MEKITDTLIGQTIGSFAVEKLLGEGAFGRVYLATHPTIDRKVAIKILNQSFSSDEKVVHRFISEAKAVNHINNPNIIQIFDFGQISDGRFYCIMEFIDGSELTKVINERDSFSIGEVFGIVRQIVDGLSAAHDAGVIHRDLKPDNIMVKELNGQFQVKILDFGIAKLTESVEVTALKTKTGQVIGTPAYMAPEQAKGEIEIIGPQTDIYSLGVIVYQMLSGDLPIKGRSVSDLLVNLLLEQPKPLTEIVKNLPEDLSRVIHKCLEKSPDARYSTVKEFFNEFFEVIREVDPSVLAEDLVRIKEKHISEMRSSQERSKLSSKDATRASSEKSAPEQKVATAETLNSGALYTQSTIESHKNNKVLWLAIGVLSLTIVAVVLFFTVFNKKSDRKKRRTEVSRKIERKRPVVVKNTMKSMSVAKKVIEPGKPKPAAKKAPEIITGMKLINLKDMCFTQGYQKGDESEKPEHRVCLDPYYMDIHEVSVDEYKKCVDARVCSEPDTWNEKSPDLNTCNWKKPDKGSHPVNCVTWQQASGFCAWAGKRLPSEAEWEFAARGTKVENLYPWGSAEADCNRAVIYDQKGEGCGRKGTWRCGGKAGSVSEFGIFDLSGNVWEWTADFFDPNYYKTCGSEIKNPTGPKSSPASERVLRGGGWSTGSIRATFRQGLAESKKFSHVGFRCVKSLKKQ